MVLLPANVDSALAWADRLYADVSPLPRGNPAGAIRDAADAYRQVLDRYPTSRANVGLGNCLMLLGRYREAAKVFGPSSSVATSRQRIAESCRKIAKSRLVLQVEPASGQPGRWLVLFGKRTDSSLPNDTPEYGDIALALVAVRNGKAVILGGETPMAKGDEDEVRRATLYVTSLEAHRLPVALVYVAHFGADNDHNEQKILAIRRNSLKPIKELRGMDEAEYFPPSPGHGLCAVVTATWKIWWHDVYEWRGGHFVFANRWHPEVYRLSKIDVGSDSYVQHMTDAAELTIQGRIKEALNAWKRAERTCQMSIWYGQESFSRFWDAGFYGGTRDNLREIRRRIRWLQKGQLNHPLLYRPYDFDLQVPPYRLGSAGSEP